MVNKSTVTVNNCDFPDYNFSFNFPTCQSPPCHIVSSDIYLGASVTADPPGSGDTDAASDVDDGVSFPNNIRPNINIRIPVTIYNNTTQTSYLSAWIDWNGDGDFEDAGEQIANEMYDYATYNGTFMVSLPVFVPADVNQTGQIAARFRVSTDGLTVASPCGLSVCAPDGEIEDYLIQVECPQEICLPPTVQINRN